MAIMYNLSMYLFALADEETGVIIAYDQMTNERAQELNDMLKARQSLFLWHRIEAIVTKAKLHY